MDADATMRTRYDEVGLRNLLRDAEVHVDRLALCVAGNDPHWLGHFADMTATVFRRRGVAMDDVVHLMEGLRVAARGVLSPEEMVPADGGARRGRPRLPLVPPSLRRRAQEEPDRRRHLQGHLTMTIKWVKVDPLVMNGEPFCYGSRLTVRQVLELRRNGYTVVDLLKDHPELRLVGIAEAYAYAGANRDRYADFFEADGSLTGPGCTEAEAATLPDRLRVPGVVVKPVAVSA